MPTRFDYIVVGAGTAGAVLAARLSADPDVRVLLVEAGTAKPPAAAADPLAWPRLARTSVDWDFATVPQRRLRGGVLRWPRGKMLGGSSGINGLMHIRADRASYDDWALVGWGYTDLLPFLKRSETAAHGDPVFRGTRGPMHVSVPEGTEPLWEACFEAAVDAGHAANPDGNGAEAEGTSWNEMNVVDGVRQSATDAYLVPILDRPNLTVRADLRVDCLIFEGDACRGVSVPDDLIYADREVVLAAGAIGSPHLLQLSGIGPARHLRAVGIDVVTDLPGVGANLHDHPKAEITYQTPIPVRARRLARKPHVLHRSGFWSRPDLQMIFLDAVVHPRWAPGPEDGFSVVFSLMTPQSRGTVRLAGPDPLARPLIDPNYLSEEGDVKRMVTGFRMAREVGMGKALAHFGGVEAHPGPDTFTDDELVAHLRRGMSTYHHPGGTCRIGIDPFAVVDPSLRVRGVTNLRVADASVMPTPIAGNTNATVLGIAERAASLLTGETT